MTNSKNFKGLLLHCGMPCSVIALLTMGLGVYQFAAVQFPGLSSLGFYMLPRYVVKVANADAAIPWQFGLQDPATPVIEGIVQFHHDLMVILLFVCTFVIYMMGRAVQHFFHTENHQSDGVVHGTLIEIVWTIVPALILMVIAIPSFALLYSVDEVVDPALTLKVVGHQWYWSYEYSDYSTQENAEGIAFDSYMLPEDELEEGGLRLLEVDNRLVLPVDTHIRVVVTGADVLHCWTVPSFGLKIDACPGRLNQASLFVEREGVYYGQCSEICGVNHGFMPIAVEVVNLSTYLTWVYNHLYEDVALVRYNKGMRLGILQVCLIVCLGFLLFGNVPKKVSELSYSLKLLRRKWGEEK